MKIQELIEKRFAELAKKAESVAETARTHDTYVSVDSDIYHEWATGVLGLLQSVFGEASPHYKNFVKLYQGFKGMKWEFENSRGVFRAAKEDYASGYLFTVRDLSRLKIHPTYCSKRLTSFAQNTKIPLVFSQAWPSRLL